MMNGGGIPPQSATPTPEEEKNPEYLKELQAEKDGLESAYAAAMATATSGQQSSEAENNSDPDSAASKTNHAIKLLEQGRTIDLFYYNFSCYWVFFNFGIFWPKFGPVFLNQLLQVNNIQRLKIIVTQILRLQKPIMPSSY